MQEVFQVQEGLPVHEVLSTDPGAMSSTNRKSVGEYYL